MLKPGGSLAVEQHRAPDGADPRAGTGYVPESYVVEEARKAGFVLEAKSEINANPKTPKTILSAFGRCRRRVAAHRLGSPLNRTLTTQNTMRSGLVRPNDPRVSKSALGTNPSEVGILPGPDSAVCPSVHRQRRGLFEFVILVDIHYWVGKEPNRAKIRFKRLGIAPNRVDRSSAGQGLTCVRSVIAIGTLSFLAVRGGGPPPVRKAPLGRFSRRRQRRTRRRAACAACSMSSTRKSIGS